MARGEDFVARLVALRFKKPPPLANKLVRSTCSKSYIGRAWSQVKQGPDLFTLLIKYSRLKYKSKGWSFSRLSFLNHSHVIIWQTCITGVLGILANIKGRSRPCRNALVSQETQIVWLYQSIHAVQSLVVEKMDNSVNCHPFSVHMGWIFNQVFSDCTCLLIQENRSAAPNNDFLLNTSKTLFRLSMQSTFISSQKCGALNLYLSAGVSLSIGDRRILCVLCTHNPPAKFRWSIGIFYSDESDVDTLFSKKLFPEISNFSRLATCFTFLNK